MKMKLATYNLKTTSKTFGIKYPLKTVIPRTQLINIAGVLYKSTKSKLLRTKIERKTVTSVKKLNRCMVTVQGIKYIMNENGRTLSKIPDVNDNQKPGLRRINIGGVLYISKNDSTLTRVSNQTSTVSQFKPNRNLKLSNMPCLQYQRTGICKRHNIGKCVRVHDKNRIAMCRKFLHSSCEDKTCCLSHNPCKEKMPICLHFLSGLCSREDCAYLHVKHSDSVPVCEQFLHGYCNYADKCKRRHIFVCPEFDKTGKCIKKKCPFPHKTKSKLSSILKITNKKNKNLEKSYSKKQQPIDQKDASTRYYVSNENNQAVDYINQSELDKDMCATVSNDDSFVPVFKRPKLGALPSYIPL